MEEVDAISNIRWSDEQEIYIFLQVVSFTFSGTNRKRERMAGKEPRDGRFMDPIKRSVVWITNFSSFFFFLFLALHDNIII